MKLREIGTSGIRVSPVLMGTWQAGKKMWAGIEDSDILRALRAAYEAGINTFDTAEVYGDGYSERLIGQTLSEVRDRVVYATKVFSNHLKYDQVIDACHRSLENLNTSYIDLYQIHWPAGSFRSEPVPIRETMSALNDLKAQGKIRAVGVSNFSLAELEEAASYGRIDSLQPPYSLFWRHVEEDLRPYCLKNNITILAYSPMAQGILAGKFRAGHKFARGDHRAKNRLFQPEIWEHVQPALEQLHPIAIRNGLTLGQLALAWVIAQPNTCAIAGARNAEQVIQNAKAAGVSLSKADLAEMDRIGRTVTDRLDENPVPWDF